MLNKLLTLVLALLSSYNLLAQRKTDKFLQDALLANEDSASVLYKVLSNPSKYRVQIIYTRIDRDKKNRPSFKNYHYNYDPALYFNPASMVKLPVAILALEKVNGLKNNDISMFTRIQFDSAYERQVKGYADSSSEDGYPSIGHYIRRAFLISENDPYNRLYQFVGQQELHKSLRDKSYKTVRIPRQFMGFTAEQNRYANPFRFVREDGSVIYSEPLRYNPDTIAYPPPILIGKGFMRAGRLIEEPFDFAPQNFMSLGDMQKMMQTLMFPNSMKKKQRFNLNYNDYQFLYKFLSQYPSETMYPKYDAEQYYDSYVKFFFRNKEGDMPKNVRVFNKVGWAYGFLTDVSYVIDTDRKAEYFLSATIYANEDEILNDNKYDYDEIGYPFLYQLGQKIYLLEKQREKKYLPDLSDFYLSYDERDPADQRPVIKDADN